MVKKVEMNSKRIITFITAILFLTNIVAAQEKANKNAFSRDSIMNIDEITVMGKRPLATTQTIKGADLQALSSTSVADALKYFAGVQIKDMGGLGGLKTINVRSLGSQHVGVYIDGIRITNAQNGTVDLGKYSLTTLESVALYNANKLDECQTASEYASGATVYLRTRRPTNDSLSAQVRWASFHTYMGKINAQFAHKGWSGFIDGEFLDSKGDYPFRYHSQVEDTIGTRANSDIRYGRVESALFKGGFSSHVYYYNSVRGCPGGIVRRLSDKYINVGREWDQDLFVQASYQHQFNEHHRFKTNTKYSYEYLRYCTDYPENQNTARVNNHYRNHDVYGAASYSYIPFRWFSLNTGYDIRWSTMFADLKNFSVVHRLDQKTFLSALMNYKGLQTAATMLYQHYKDHTFANAGAAEPLQRFTPTISMGYTIHDVTIRAWYKKIFRAPTLNDLYYTQVGNRNLKPEYTKQLNIGIEWNSPILNLHKGGALSASLQCDVYQNKIENRIVCLPLKGTYSWSMMNYGYTFCQGLNANAKAMYSIAKWSFSALTSLTWQRDVNRTDPDDEDTYNKPICYSPRLSYGITGIIKTPSLTKNSKEGVSLTISDLHVGERMWSYADPEDILDPYNNIDVKLTLPSPFKGTEGTSLSLEINDLLDKQYEHVPRYPMPGRNWKLTLTVAL